MIDKKEQERKAKEGRLVIILRPRDTEREWKKLVKWRC